MSVPPEAKAVAAHIQANVHSVRPQILSVVDASIVGNDEVPYIRSLAAKLPLAIRTVLQSIGVTATTRAEVIHKKPVVRFRHAGTGQPTRCELGDLLFVVKYEMADKTRVAKSVVWQVKSCDKPGSRACRIDPKQLILLHQWPTFEFGRDIAGTPQTFTLSPTRLEFGSYMLMLRRPQANEIVANYRLDKGVSASAWRVAAGRSLKVDVGTINYVLTATDGLLNQLVFMYGEPHSTAGLQPLVDALYRLVGWDPDPPTEFDGYLNDYDGQPANGVFAIIETVIHTADSRLPPWEQA